MVFHYAGKYDGDESRLPHREQPEGAIPFREPDMKTLAIVANIGSIITTFILGLLFALRIRGGGQAESIFLQIILGCILPVLFLPIHEILHAINFRKDVYMYTNLSQGLMFVVGTEDMSRRRFIFMSLCPNLILGVIPYTVGMLFPPLVFLGVFGAISVGMGFGDYINVYNALRQVPHEAKTYLNGMHSFWYIEK